MENEETQLVKRTFPKKSSIFDKSKRGGVRKKWVRKEAFDGKSKQLGLQVCKGRRSVICGSVFGRDSSDESGDDILTTEPCAVCSTEGDNSDDDSSKPSVSAIRQPSKASVENGTNRKGRKRRRRKKKTKKCVLPNNADEGNMQMEAECQDDAQFELKSEERENIEVKIEEQEKTEVQTEEENKNQMKLTENFITAQEDEIDCESKAFREEIANMPLGEAKKLKERIGIKLFNKAYYANEDLSGSKDQAQALPRANPKRPREMSSKRPISKFHKIFKNEKIVKERYDPRFDDRCGEFAEEIFQRNYGFLNDIRNNEKKILKKELGKLEVEDSAYAERMKEALRRMKNQEITLIEKNRRKQVISEIRRENNERMRQGLPPTYKTKAQIRNLVKAKKMEELKGSRKLDGYLKRRSKKENKKAVANIPYA